MDSYNRKIVSIIAFLRKFISVFFTLFFNIYVLKIVNDVSVVLKYNLVGIVFDGIFSIIISSKLNNKNAKIIYN